MSSKKALRMAVDIAMLVIMPLLMAYTLIGSKFHETAGTAVFLLFIFHHILNRRWYKGFIKGRYTPSRIIQTMTDVALLIYMIAQPLSGILMSGYLFRFIHAPESITQAARAVHLPLAFWGYILISFHAGWHVAAPLRRLKAKHPRAWISLTAAGALLSLYGIPAFFKRRFLTYLLARSPFMFLNFTEPKIFFFIDYVAVMVLFMSVGGIVMNISSGNFRKHS